MLQECMEVFRENEKKYSMQWFWDNHIPKDGVYILINTQNGSVIGAPIRIRMDKRTGNIQGQECSQYELISFIVMLHIQISVLMYHKKWYILIICIHSLLRGKA